MNTRLLVAGALFAMTSQAANATVYFDSIDVPAPMFGSDGPTNAKAPVNVMADSFADASGNASHVGLLLATDNPSDGGSSTVLLVPDNGAGSPGVAGAPKFGSGALALGTIADASLAKLSSGGSTLVSLQIPAAGIATSNGEYWIEVLPGVGSSVEWYFASGDVGVGVAGQSSYFSFISGGSSVVADSNTQFGGPYDLIVDAPEPASTALLGCALILLGCVIRLCRRNPPKI